MINRHNLCISVLWWLVVLLLLLPFSNGYHSPLHHVQPTNSIASLCKKSHHIHTRMSGIARVGNRQLLATTSLFLSPSSTTTTPQPTHKPDLFIQAEGSGSPCRIKVIGVGGGGGNAVNRMLESATGVSGVELWTVNTDAQALARNLSPNKLTIGHVTSR